MAQSLLKPLNPMQQGLLGFASGALTVQPNYGAFSPGPAIGMGLNAYQNAKQLEAQKRQLELEKMYRNAQINNWLREALYKRKELQSEEDRFKQGLDFAREIMSGGELQMPGMAPTQAPAPAAAETRGAFSPRDLSVPTPTPLPGTVSTPTSQGAPEGYSEYDQAMQDARRQRLLSEEAGISEYEVGGPEMKRPMQPRSVIGEAMESIESDRLMRQGAALQFIPGMEDAGKAVQKWGEYLNNNRKWALEMKIGAKEIDTITGHVIDNVDDRIYRIDENGKPHRISSAQHAEARNKYMRSSASKVSATATAGADLPPYVKEGQKEALKITNEMEKRANSAWRDSRALDRFIAESDSAQGGALQPVISMAQNFFASFGFNPDGLKSVDAMNSALSEMLENRMMEMGARGLTDMDMNILKNHLPKIATSKESRVNVARVLKKVNDYDIMLYKDRYEWEQDAYPQMKRQKPRWLKEWEKKSIPPSAVDAGLTQEDWDAMPPPDRELFK